MANNQQWQARDIFWGFLILLPIGFVLWLLVSLVGTDHRVQQYYMSRGFAGTSCVSASVNWDQDETVFCSDDKERVLEFMSKANEALRRGR
jgi:hypothetical protein